MNLMSKLNHPNIVKFITGWYNRKLKKVVMITEFISVKYFTSFKIN